MRVAIPTPTLTIARSLRSTAKSMRWVSPGSSCEVRNISFQRHGLQTRVHRSSSKLISATPSKQLRTSPRYRNPSTATKDFHKSHFNFRGPMLYAASGALISVLALSGGLYMYYRSHFEKVPITERERMLWYDHAYDEEIGYPVEGWLLGQKDKPMLDKDDPVTTFVREIFDRLLKADIAKGLDVKLFVFDDFANPNAWAGPGQHGGRMFINTGCLWDCQTVNEVAGILSHELGHVVARHAIERRAAHAFAREIAKWFGFKGRLGEDLVTLRIQETEADHMGLMIMAETGFDPQGRVDYLIGREAAEKKRLNGRDPTPEFLSTHPTLANRLALASSLLPEANALFEKKGKGIKVDGDLKSWDPYRTELKRRLQIYVDKYHADEAMKPEILLSKLEQKITSLENAWIRNVELGRELAEKEKEKAKEMSPKKTTEEEVTLTTKPSETVIQDAEKEESHVDDEATEEMTPPKEPALATPTKAAAMTEETNVQPDTTEGNEDTKESSETKEESKEQDSG